MMNEKSNYKLVFFSLFCAYTLAQIPIVLLRPELTQYITILQLFCLVVPLLFLYYSTNESNYIKFGEAYKLKFKFNIAVIPCILWIVLGVNMFNEGLLIVSQYILPPSVLSFVNEILEKYAVRTMELSKVADKSLEQFLLVGMCITVLPAFCEEILFRGYLMQSIAVRNGQRYAIWMSAAIFAAIHLAPTAFIPIFILGIFLGKLVYATNSLFPSILLHFCNNLLAFLYINFATEINNFPPNLTVGIVFLVISIIVLIVNYRILVRLGANQIPNILTNKLS